MGANLNHQNNTNDFLVRRASKARHVGPNPTREAGAQRWQREMGSLRAARKIKELARKEIRLSLLVWLRASMRSATTAPPLEHNKPQ